MKFKIIIYQDYCVCVLGDILQNKHLKIKSTTSNIVWKVSHFNPKRCKHILKQSLPFIKTILTFYNQNHHLSLPTNIFYGKQFWRVFPSSRSKIIMHLIIKKTHFDASRRQTEAWSVKIYDDVSELPLFRTDHNFG